MPRQLHLPLSLPLPDTGPSEECGMCGAPLAPDSLDGAVGPGGSYCSTLCWSAHLAEASDYAGNRDDLTL